MVVDKPKPFGDASLITTEPAPEWHPNGPYGSYPAPLHSGQELVWAEQGGGGSQPSSTELDVYEALPIPAPPTASEYQFQNQNPGLIAIAYA